MKHFPLDVKPPYFAVIFTAQMAETDDQKYGEMAEKMIQLARQQPGYLGVETARNQEGFGITVSYWFDLESIANWKQNAEHLVAQRQGLETWYANLEIRVCEIQEHRTWTKTEQVI